jgi:hypothetical protein
MDFSTVRRAPDRPGKTSFWTAARAAVRQDTGDSTPGASLPANVRVNTLDPVRSAFWQSFRHLFPPHSLAAQTPGGSVVISWSVMDDPHARYPYAAPVMLRFDEALVEAMGKANKDQRMRLARKHEATLREGLRGYDPFARFPNARVVVIG